MTLSATEQKHLYGEPGTDSNPLHAWRSLPGEKPRRIWSSGSLYVDVLPSADLGNSSFVVVDRGQGAAAIIDATRDIGRYLELVERLGLSLKWVLDTHLHADFVSGGRGLAALSGAKLGLCAEAETTVRHQPLHDQEEIDLGSAVIKVIKSPGHTPEHISFLLREETGRSRVLFSGGSLMAGTAGRPDLLGPQYTYQLVQEEFATLHERYAGLPPELVVLPTHVGGSFCGVGSRSAPRTSLGLERQTNPLLLTQDRNAFLAAYLSGNPFPKYYRNTRLINQRGTRPIGREIPDLVGLSPEEVEELGRRPGTTILDIREPRAFESGHIPKSLSVPVGGQFSAWVGWLRNAEEEIVIVDDDPEARHTAQVALLRTGFDRLEGYLQGGIEAYARAGFTLSSTTRRSMRSVRRAVEKGEALTLLDVRNPDEAALERLPGAVNIPLPDLAELAPSRLDRRLPLYVHCQSGWRAGIAASVLEQLGFPQVLHVVDGPEAWKSAMASARSDIRTKQ
jgi:hydroxyacylglutathione hydrolase